MSQAANDVEVEIPEGQTILTEKVEELIANSVHLLKTGANPATVLRTLYLFGFMDGGLEVLK